MAKVPTLAMATLQKGFLRIALVNTKASIFVRKRLLFLHLWSPNVQLTGALKGAVFRSERVVRIAQSRSFVKL